MLRKINDISSSPLARGSFIIFTGSMLTNFLNYVYNVIMGRLLGPVDYGILISLISLLYILSVPATTLNTVCVKFSSQFIAKGEYHKIWLLLEDFTKKILIFGTTLFFLFFIFSSPLASFLNIPSNKPVIILALLLPVTFLWTVNSSTLQGLKNFSFVAFSNILSALGKLGLGVLFVILGLAVNGALLAIILGVLISYLVSFFPLFSLRKNRDTDVKLEYAEILKYAFPTLLVAFGFTLINNFDIVLVKRYFTESDAGLYAALSLIGKIIFFASSSVAAVMFPLVSERHAVDLKYSHIFKKALLLVSLVCLGLNILYFLFPSLVIQLVFGAKYLSIAPFVGPFGVFLSLYSLGFVFVNFFLAIYKTSVAILPLIFAFLQAILIIFYHDSFWQVISVSLFSMSFLLASLVVYYLKVER